MQPEDKVTVVIPTWNQRDLTHDCLRSLAGVDYPAGRLSILVVDNGSTDGTVPLIRKRFSHVAILENGENLGVAAANNLGIRYALDTGADLVMLLNNDTLVDPPALRQLVCVLSQDPGLGAAGPWMYYAQPADRLWCAGNSIDWRLGGSTRLWADRPAREVPVQGPYEVEFITSCAVCIRRQLFEEIGLMDERFFIYYDEADWFVRAATRGWRFAIVPEARIWHRVSAAMGESSPATDYYMMRNALLFLGKHLRGVARLRSLSLAVSRQLLTIAAYTAKPQGGRRIPHRNSRLLALRDAVLGRWGKMGADVAAVCYAEDP
jgi:GT2 family glycosyltransferase